MVDPNDLILFLISRQKNRSCAYLEVDLGSECTPSKGIPYNPVFDVTHNLVLHSSIYSRVLTFMIISETEFLPSSIFLPSCLNTHF